MSVRIRQYRGPVRLRRAGVLGALSLGLAALSPAVAAAATAPLPFAQQNTNPNNQNTNNFVISNNNGGAPSPAATPELSSVLLFGAGAAGLAGYARTRYLATRRRSHPADEEPTAP